MAGGRRKIQGTLRNSTTVCTMSANVGLEKKSVESMNRKINKNIGSFPFSTAQTN
jgi:hypothetical protein